MGTEWSKNPDNPDVETIGRNCRYRYSAGKDFIGKGTFGVVYNATITERGDYTGADVVAVKAVKDVQREMAMDQETWDKTLEKLRKLPELSHRHLVPYYQIRISKGPDGGTIEIMMERCSGDLASFLKEARSNTNLLNRYADVERYCHNITTGLDFLHQQGIIHGDLKPANILVKNLPDNTKHLLIGDLDDLVLMHDKATCSKDISQLRGTYSYMSPEMLKKFNLQIAQAEIGRKTDIWSLGCIMLEIAECHINRDDTEKKLEKNGKIVSLGKSNIDFASRILKGYVPFIGDDIPAHLAACVELCLKPIPKDRISARELLQKLPAITITVISSIAHFGELEVLHFDPLNMQLREQKVSVPYDLPAELYRLQLSIPNNELTFYAVRDKMKLEMYMWNIDRNTWRMFSPTSNKSKLVGCSNPVIIKDLIYYLREPGDGCEYVAVDMRNGQEIFARPAPIKARQDMIALAECDQKILYAHNRDGRVTALELYDPVADQRKPLPDLPQARNQFAMTFSNGYVYIIGGKIIKKKQPWDATAGCIRLNIETDACWEDVPSLREPRYRHSACVVNDTIYVFGGRNAADGHLLAFEMYDTWRGGSWSTVVFSPHEQQLLQNMRGNLTERWDRIRAFATARC
ncbi:uncharacterized protein LOC129600738 [Paramacrobiotus metropolitanus]|uniref:uncharacterized protein LOC129600738 n=1 Tax=Paramacrobiotus metropolitanus TaxID=2943436 RepID=UPI00244603C1|nr:uncharacterized protein LOC129600738 [Paramacrobiotus metropolitanus]